MTRRWTTADDRAVIDWYQRRENVRDILAEFGITAPQLYVILRRHDVPVRFPAVAAAVKRRRQQEREATP